MSSALSYLTSLAQRSFPQTAGGHVPAPQRANPFSWIKILSSYWHSLHNCQTSWKNSLLTSHFSQIMYCLVYWNFSNSKSPMTLLLNLVFSSQPSFYMSSLQNLTLWSHLPTEASVLLSFHPPSSGLTSPIAFSYHPVFNATLVSLDFCLGSTSLLPHHILGLKMPCMTEVFCVHLLGLLYQITTNWVA